MLIFIMQILPLCWFYVINLTSLVRLNFNQLTLACQNKTGTKAGKARTSFLELLYPDTEEKNLRHLEWWRFGITWAQLVLL